MLIVRVWRSGFCICICICIVYAPVSICIYIVYASVSILSSISILYSVLYSVFYTYLFICVAVGRGSWAMLVVHSSHFTVYDLRFTGHRSAVGSRRVCHPVYRSFITYSVSGFGIWYSIHLHFHISKMGLFIPYFYNSTLPHFHTS